MTVSTMAWVLLALMLAELVALAVVIVLLVRSRARVSDLEQQLTARTGGRRAVAGRAVRAFVDTAVRLRDDGLGGMLAGSLDDLARIVGEDRARIEEVAAPDGTVSLLFSDIEDSTARNEKLGDAAWVRLLAAHNRLVRSACAAHAGHVVKTQGDGFMIAFGDPADAVRTALDVQARLRAGGGRRLRRSPVSVRIGIHVGPVVSREGDYFGRNVAVAARVAAQAVGGETLVSADIEAALEPSGEFAFTLVGDVALKGLTGTYEIWRCGIAD